mgnify:CR=1 FL=1
MREHSKGTNSYQTPAWRKAKYTLARHFGHSVAEARRARDFRLRTLHAQIASLAHLGSIDFTEELVDDIFEPWLDLEARGYADIYVAP